MSALSEFQSYLYGIEMFACYVFCKDAHSFNRTFMELKSKYTAKNWTDWPSFNRTFMELKLIKNSVIDSFR